LEKFEHARITVVWEASLHPSCSIGSTVTEISHGILFPPMTAAGSSGSRSESNAGNPDLVVPASRTLDFADYLKSI